MRTVLIISFFACIYLHFHDKGGKLEEQDVLTTKQSSLKRPAAKSEEIIPESEKPSLVPATPQAIENESMVTSADVAEEYEDDDLSQLPWDDIEEGWKTQLKEFLTSVDPEKAEEMFAAYMEEKKKYVERVDFGDTENGVAQDLAAENGELSTEQDSKEGELERMHVENLKGIFGDHYSSVKALHKEYVDSVQYLNRSSIKFTISL